MKQLAVLSLLLVCTLGSGAAAENLSESFAHKLQSRYFTFYYGDDIKDIHAIRRIADGFIDIVNKDLLEARFNFPMDVYILPDEYAFEDFLLKKFGMMNTVGLYGIYLSSIHGFVTYQNSGYGTFTHEIMHPLLQENLPRLPEWASEGIPSFFEKFFGYWQDGKLVLKFGFQNPWRIIQLGDRLLSLNLDNIINFPNQHDSCEKRMVSVFLYQNGKLRRYLELVKAQDKRGFNTFLEATFEKTSSEIRPMWDQYLKAVERNKSKILRTPPSQVFETKALFDEFVNSLNLRDGSGS